MEHSIDIYTILSLPCIVEFVISYLDVPSALALRSTGRLTRTACSLPELASWRQDVVLPVLQAARQNYNNEWFTIPIMNDAHFGWLLKNNNNHPLTEIDLGNAPYMTDMSLKAIGNQCPRLTSFRVTRGQDWLRIHLHQELRGLTTTGVVQLLQGCQCLQHLCLSWCESVDGDTVCETIQGNPSLQNCLRSLNLDGVPTTDWAIAAISGCPHLESLFLRDTQATDVSPLKACHKLQTLHLCRGRSIRPESVIQAAEGFQKTIQVLCCAGCWAMDVPTSIQILNMCQKSIQVWNCKRGTECGGVHYTEREDLESMAKSLDVCLDDPNICP